MSYDISIKLEEAKRTDTLKKIISKFEEIENFRFKVGDKYYMEIDLEPDELDPKNKIGEIVFHIPYSFLDIKNVDFEVYFTLIQMISEEVNSPAFDRQLGVYLTDPKFIAEKPIVIQGAVQLSKLTYEKEILSVHCAYSSCEFIWDIFNGNFLDLKETKTSITNYDCYSTETNTDTPSLQKLTK